MVSRLGPFRRYYWLEGRRSEPSWLRSWVDSPEDHFAKSFSFFSNPSFCRICRFCFSLPRHPLSCFCHLHCLSSPARHTPPPTTLLHTPLAPISPYPSPPLVALVCSRNPPQTTSKTLNSLFVPSCRHSAHVSGAPHTTSYLRLTRDRCPLDPLTPLTCISGLTLLPLPARQTRLDCTFWRSFL
jgi:hypothetical protein